MPGNELSLQTINEFANAFKDGFFIYDVEAGEFRFLNAVIRKIFGLEDLSLPASDLSVFLNRINPHDHAFLSHQFKKLLRQGWVLQVEFKCHPKQTYISCDAYYLDQSKTVIGTVKDITRAKEHEDYVVNFGGQKDTLLEIICHNLSGPLMLMQNVIRKAEQQAEGNGVGSAEVYPLINGVTQQCIDIINDFLEREHMESEKIIARKNLFDAVDKVRMIVENSRRLYEFKNFGVTTIHEHLYVHGDDVKFLQVLNNLISNAIKFTHSTGSIVVDIQKTESTFIVSVADNGIGIPAHLQEHLFKRHSMASRPGLRGEVSNGIGLYISKRLVERMKGKIWYYTSENNGSTFYVELPLE
ncbi:PAS domain-containing sensor histidine kinase [Ohtaekwangia sp.]|uniref:PAS domain-containing sensor histidine kinase n=1 Tax=Ohtaekwangia sp. TaxID=2066019 RepID=UPI002F938B5A